MIRPRGPFVVAGVTQKLTRDRTHAKVAMKYDTVPNPVQNLPFERTIGWRSMAQSFKANGTNSAARSKRNGVNSTHNDSAQVQGGNFDLLIGRIQKTTGEGREAIERFLGGLTADSSATVTRAAETARDYAEQAGERLYQGYRRAEGIVRHRPGSAVASAFGIGVIVGVVLVLATRRR